MSFFMPSDIRVPAILINFDGKVHNAIKKRGSAAYEQIC